MATTTPNYGWPVPTSSDLVKNGATAIEALGDAADATMATMVAKAIVDAKGDIIAATAADTVSRLAVGANDTVLTADSTAATGLKWAAAAGGSSDIVRITQTVVATAAASVDFTSIPSTYRNLYVVYQCRGTSAQINGNLMVRFNSDSGANYDSQALYSGGTSVSSAEALGSSNIIVGKIPQATATANVGGSSRIEFPNYVGTTFNKELIATGGYKYGTSTNNINTNFTYGQWRNTAAITSMSFFEGQYGGNIAVGSVFTLYGEK